MENKVKDMIIEKLGDYDIEEILDIFNLDYTDIIINHVENKIKTMNEEELLKTLNRVF